MLRRRTRLRIGVLSMSYVKQLHYYIDNVLGVDPWRYISNRLYYTCLNNICLINEETGRINSVSLIYSGLWIGLIINDRVYLSPQLYEKIYSENELRASIIVNENGVRSFLYGRDILEESIVEKHSPLNNAVSVIDRVDYRVIGVAEPRDKGIYRNIYDLGWFIRIFG